MDQEADEHATNLLASQYSPTPPPPSSSPIGARRQELLPERTLNQQNDEAAGRRRTPGRRGGGGNEEEEEDDDRDPLAVEMMIQPSSNEQIELTDLAPSKLDCSTDDDDGDEEEIIAEQPTSMTSMVPTVGTPSSKFGIRRSGGGGDTTIRAGGSSAASSSGFVERLALGALDNGGAGGDDEDELLISPRPTKSQVLHYFARAHKFSIRRVERDIQITDSEGFPLFDAYVDSDCAGRVWTIESYGKPVLYMRDYAANDLCQRSSTRAARVSVRDWNGDMFGELSPGDPFHMHDSDRKLVAKFVRQQCPPSSSSSSAAPIEESTTTALTVSTTTTATMMMNGSVNGSTSSSGPLLLVPPTMASSNKSNCWLCVQEETDRHLVRLEDYKSIQFNKDVAFQLKLLSLAAIIRIVGQVGGLTATPGGNCIGVVKTILNCCAGY